jgi:anti-sigma B factor antagonist
VSSLSLDTRHDGAVTVLALHGDLDLATVPHLREPAVQELARPECKTLGLDLAGVTFLDSTGLGCWIDLRNEAQARGKSLEFESAPQVVRRTVSIAGLAELFGMSDSEI